MTAALLSMGSRSANRKPPAYRSSSISASISAATLTTTRPVPTGTRVGDVMLMVVAGGTSDTIATPSGWTLQAGPIDSTGTGTNGRAYLFSRTSDGSGSDGPTVTKTGANTTWRVSTTVWGATDGVDVVASGFRASATTDTAPILSSVTPTVDQATLVGVIVGRVFTTGDHTAPPAHFIEVGFGGGGAPTTETSRRSPVDPVASGTATGTLTTASKWVTFTVALKNIAPSSIVVRSYPGTAVYPSTSFYPGV